MLGFIFRVMEYCYSAALSTWAWILPCSHRSPTECARVHTRLDLLPLCWQCPFVSTARVLWRMPLPLVWQGENLSSLSFCHSRNPALLERRHHLCSLPGVLKATDTDKRNNMCGKKQQLENLVVPCPSSVACEFVVFIFLPALFLQEPTEQQLLLGRNFILKGKKDVFYVTANSMAKLQPRYFLGYKLPGMFPFVLSF